MVPKPGLEPGRVSPLPPQDSVSTKFHHFGGSSQTLFGSSGPGTLLGKMTTGIAVVFMLTSLWLAYFAVHKGSSVMQGAAPVPVEQPAPAPPVPPAPAPEKK